MPRTLQFKRYGSATLANTTGANGELIINSTNKTLTIHDGVTRGGFVVGGNANTSSNIDQVARNTANTATSNITVLQGVNVTQNTNITNVTNLAQAAYNYANTISTTSNYSNENVAIYLANYDGSINFTASPAIISGVGTLSTAELRASARIISPTTNLIFDRANSALTLAQEAYNYANTIVSDTQVDPVARATANSATANTIILQGVNSTQNTSITSATNLAQAAFNNSNTKFNSAGGEITGNVTISSDLTVTGNIIPSSNNTSDLGSPSNRFRHIYASGGTLYLGDIKLTNANGKLEAKKVINAGEDNEQDDEDSDAFSEVRGGGGPGLGNFKFDGSTLGTQGDEFGWGDHNMYLDPGGESGAYLSIPSVPNQEAGGDLTLWNTGSTNSRIKLYARNTVQVTTNDGVGGGDKSFEFDNDGRLRLPAGGDIIDSNGTSVLGSTSGLPSLTVPSEPAQTYKGLQVSYGVVHTNSSSDEYNVNKIVIHEPAEVTLDIDPDGGDDYFRVSGLNSSNVLAMFVVFGNTNGPKPLSDLQTFAEAVINNVILDGGVEGQYNTVADMKLAFYENYDTLATAANGLYSNFQFFDSSTPVTSGTTTVIQGGGAVFNFGENGAGQYTFLGVVSSNNNYKVGHKLKVLGSVTGGVDGVNDAIFTVTEVGTGGFITAATVTGNSFSTAPVGGWFSPATNHNVGSGFSVSAINFNPNGTWNSFSLDSQGSNYVAGDQVVLLGSNIQNGVTPDNNITITITSVDESGMATNWVESGTYPRVWPISSISDGGADQYDGANYISSSIGEDISYNQGNTVIDGTDAFGEDSSYSFVYRNSIFGLLVTGNQATFIETNGNSGADGDSITETGSIYAPSTPSQTFDNAVTHINIIGDPWAGPSVNFTRPNDSDETIDILIVDDGDGAGVAIARNSNQQGIFNPYREEGWNSSASPSGTLWNIDGWTDLSDVESRNYQPLYQAFGSGGLGNKIVGTECVMYLPDNGKYYAIKFNSWTQGGNGGGFAYTRRELDLDNLQQGIRFSDGTRLKSAEGIGPVKLKSPGNRRIEEAYGYKEVALTPVSLNFLTTSATRTVANTNDIWIDTTETTIDDVIDNPQNYNNAYDFEFSLDEQTWYEWNGSIGYNNDERAYSIFPAQVSYNNNDTIYFRYKTGGTPVIWWDKDNLPNGGGNFRGAIIDYHAFTGESTIIGTIHIVDDDGEDHISHQEVQSGSTDGENDDLWYTTTEGQICYRRIDGEGKTLKVQWGAKVFYGSEYYDD